MSRLTGEEPQYWHDVFGRHAMKDPRSEDPAFHVFWDDDERDYVRHLEAHESALHNPQRAESDPAVISALFDMIEANEGQNAKMRALIAAYRMERQ